jgi:hypothetical protein
VGSNKKLGAKMKRAIILIRAFWHYDNAAIAAMLPGWTEGGVALVRNAILASEVVVMGLD